MGYSLRAVAAALTLTAGLTACGSAEPVPSADSPGSAGTGKGTVNLTVWVMRDSLSDALIDRFRTDYRAAHPDVVLDIQIQEWDGIGQKVTSALASNDAPDVIEVGNTQVAEYAASGGVKDLTDKVADLGGTDWLPGLAGPGRIDGRQYGIPWYAANRVVVYNKILFAKAGVTAPPKTRDEWLEITAKLDKGGDQGIYLPGQNWYTLAGFIWDEGGDLAVHQDGSWKGTFGTPQALAGMEFYKKLQALGDGPKDSDEARPPQVDVFAKGDVAQIVSAPGGAVAIEKANPELKGELGFFPIPGKTADRPGAVFTGGSNLIIPEASKHHEAAYEVVKALAGEKFQTDMAGEMSYVPNRVSLAGVLEGNEATAAMAAGAANGHATPNSPNWAAVEAKNVIKEYMTRVLTGGDAAAEAAVVDRSITGILNTTS
ncbi:N,N'-diacetylchitobiose transport system substrate-binding protein [Streptosporangium becharense]|uniref:N,N'-diacetylchitobiose transport system substrate-binding protein n=1 Tax=Streptosporangium becharense TaxID=1816182 RepID=A0A7W9IB56_9ACTN|nr:extracellular solute-binding protein [Streptosporangium becharense]MBB2910779.1 N,N'-diacetylchitobiose transport system substrate-binding protein [Streptosporangium becharense]MBB5817474.1 N,N'-diacetylchitobiose transport system substrate-binding protein [Streptosporangium becharense]